MGGRGGASTQVVSVAVVVMALWAPSSRYGFTYLDDDNLILDRAAFLARPSSTLTVFAQRYFDRPYDPYYRPVVNASFVIDAQIGGMQPWVYHLTNVFLHVLACLLLLALLRRLGMPGWPAAGAALLFGVHPVHAASVVWIPGRNDVMLGCAALGACLCLWRAAVQGNLRWLAAHVILFAVALFTKETAIILPLVFVLLLRCVPSKLDRRFRGSLAVSWSLVVAAHVTVRVLVSGLSSLAALAASPGAALSAWPVLLSDLGKLVLPLRLQVASAPEDVAIWPGWIAASLIAVGVFFLRRRRRLVVLAMALVLAPSLLGLGSAGWVVLENRLYLPAMGVAVLAGGLLCSIPDRRLAIGAVCLVAVVFAVVALRHGRSFRDRESLVAAMTVESPHCPVIRGLRFKMFYPSMPTP